ncbi:MAG TPA: hypothetical protein VMT91_10695 [Anaerolineales bacterium]|nr:hypothetical protein [Anaerolineales bacterium]
METYKGKNDHCARCFFLILTLTLIFTACNTEINPAPTPTVLPTQMYSVPRNTPTIELTESPTVVPISTVFSSAPLDGTLDTNCRITINYFFGYRRGDDLQAFRKLFTPSSQGLALSYEPPMEALVLLELMPASQYWQENYPGTPMPGAIIPEGPNEYIYYVKYTGHYDPNATPFFWYPDSMTMTMLADNSYSCKIENFGKG